jgi:small conductance mechanosensitive channel
VDLPQAMEIVRRVTTERVAAEDIAEHVLEAPEVLGVERVGPEGITLRMTVKVVAGQQWAVQRALNAAIADALDEADVPRPVYPGTGSSVSPSAP